MIVNNGLWDLTMEISKERFKIVYIKNGDESTRPGIYPKIWEYRFFE